MNYGYLENPVIALIIQLDFEPSQLVKQLYVSRNSSAVMAVFAGHMEIDFGDGRQICFSAGEYYLYRILSNLWK